jgi:hypothetical protein
MRKLIECLKFVGLIVVVMFMLFFVIFPFLVLCIWWLKYLMNINI